MDCLKVWFSHTEHPDIGEDDVPILNLMLGTVFCYIHAIEFFGKITFPKKCTDNSKSAGRDNVLICKFDNNVLVRIQGKSSVVVHGKTLLHK